MRRQSPRDRRWRIVPTFPTPTILPNKNYRPSGSVLVNMARLRFVPTRTRVAQLVLTRTFLIRLLSFLAPSLKETRRCHASSRELVLCVVFLRWWHASRHLNCGCWASVRGRCPLTNLHLPTTRAQTLQIMATSLQRLQYQSLCLCLCVFVCVCVSLSLSVLVRVCVFVCVRVCQGAPRAPENRTCTPSQFRR